MEVSLFVKKKYLIQDVFSIADSQPQAITEVANPVNELAAILAHFSVSAVTIRREHFIGNASANVSKIFIEY